VEIDAIEASVCRTNLVLCPNCLFKQLLFDVYGFGSKYLLIAHLVLERVKAEQKPNRECRTRAQAGARRQIRYVMNLDTIVDSQVLQASAHRWMLNCIVPGNVFDL